MPAAHLLMNPETAHEWGLIFAEWGLVPRCSTGPDPKILHTKVFGTNYSNPIGLAAGFDKNSEALLGLFSFGFGFVEIGSVTPELQLGNNLPRIFRLPEDKAIINRCGFNNRGHEYAHDQLQKTLKRGTPPGLIGVSLGKNKDSDATKDYIRGVELFGPLADYLVINVSSPNTPGLRQLQAKQSIEELLSKVLQARDSLNGNHPPVLIKLSPDLSPEWRKDIASVVTKKGCAVDGLIVSNTTTERPATLKSYKKMEDGGLSGVPLKQLSTDCIRDMYSLTKGKIPIIGVGGIFSGADAYEKIRAGASLVQIYSVIAYEGPPAVNRIKRELQQLLEADGFSSVSEAVGVDNKV